MGFQFWLKRREWEWRRMPDRERKKVPDHRTSVLKRLSQGPPAHPRNMEYPTSKYLRLSEESEESRDEATQRDMVLYQSQCGSRWELFCIESGCWLVASGDRRAKEWCGQIRSFADEANWAVDHYSMKENLKRASKESITTIKPRGNKRGKKGVLVASKERYCWIEVICLISS